MQVITEYADLEIAPSLTVFKPRDENNDNLKVHLEYRGNFPSSLAEGKQASTAEPCF